MTEDGKKAAVGLGIAGAVTAVIIAATKAKAAPPERAAITIEIIGPSGVPVQRCSPADLVEGESYTVRVTITNLSTKAGQPWEATLNIRVVANIAGESILGPEVSDEYFAAGQTRGFDYPMFVPLGTGGLSGSIAALVRGPTDMIPATAIEPLAIIAIGIIYGATVGITI